MFEADDLLSRFLDLCHVCLTGRLQKRMSFELIWTKEIAKGQIIETNIENKHMHCEWHLQVSLSLSSGVGATSTALLPWQLSSVGSAPWLSSSEHTSTRFLLAASCSGVNCHKSMALTHAPCCERDIQETINHNKEKLRIKTIKHLGWGSKYFSICKY